MTMPFYVAPEQLMKDKTDYARKRVALGRSFVALVYDNGIVIAAENSSKTLHKISEIYDRIGFAGVGLYNEFDQLRQFGIRQADLKGYQYSREDVDARSLANSYAQILGQIFTHEMKPYEVEILIAEVGIEPGEDQLYHVLYNGIVIDEQRFIAVGGEAEAVLGRIEEGYRDGLPLGDALKLGVKALSGPDATLEAGQLEVAVLDRGNGRRAFRRVQGDELAGLLT